MNQFNSILRKARLIVMAACVWMSAWANVWAQEEAAGSSGGGKGWALPYFLAIMGVALGMLVVCHMSRRRDKPKLEEFEE